MTTRTKRLIAVLAATTALTACTTKADGIPLPAPEGGTTEPTSSTNEEVPKVNNPLEASTFVTAPCTTLTPDQLGSFAVNPPGETRELEGVPQGCSWIGDDGIISIDWLYQNKGGLSDTYRGGTELNAYFIPADVDGYPGVFVDANDGRDSGRCGIVVGVSDALTFYAQVSNGQLGPDESCSQARQVAAAAIATVRKAS